MKNIFSLFCLLLFSGVLLAQNKTLLLWPGEVPNSIKTDVKEVSKVNGVLRISKVTMPDLNVFLPEKADSTTSAVIVCPGGGYSILSYEKEGTDIAKFLAKNGIAAVVLKYRLPDPELQINPSIAPLQDAQRAMRIVRSNALAWNVSPSKIGIMGFSAGGHFASTLGTHFDLKVYDPIDEVDAYSARPDFMVLLYPVISMDKNITHMGSRNNLIGKETTDSLVQLFSNELQVTSQTPPSFLVHSADDGAVPVQNSIRFYDALLKNNVKSEMHIYPEGGHGYGMAASNPHLNTWTSLLISWVKIDH